MSKGTMINEEIAVVLCFGICIAILVFAIMFKCTGGNNESITNNQTITEQRWFTNTYSRRKANITSLHKTIRASNRYGVKMNIIELYELNYDKEVDSIPVVLNVSKKTFNFLRYNGIYNKKDKITLTIDEILVDNIHIIKREEDSDELSGQ